ncbi:ATP-binding cassette domain-containing protein [Paenibacillus sp. NFR01]|uniref:ATP-binding cassette domain-containing protein n=1 Tax=Paenibacillus sp. NFR01 TaxID=1566279 RepID=UPI0008D0B3D1|nr:ATP-binding cassette domain-containing protein [Paenibacillus sp. NFR01]SET49923.1 ABC-2 type transport system ATP-binding protein [Paenibacillus sp. NFR01]
MNHYAVEVEGLHKSFGAQKVLEGVSFKVPAGSIFALLGPNGAGKTTLIHILSTLISPDCGSICIAGYDLSSEKEKVKYNISLTGQFAAVDEVLTAEENLRMICRLNGLTASESRVRTAELLRLFGLEEHAGKRVKTYSGGMRRRLDLAISLSVNRKVLFLDEPTTGLDTHSRRELWNMVLGLKREGITVFLTTQYLEEADELADRIAVIANGTIVAEGTAEELKSRVGIETIELRDEDDEVFLRIPTTGDIADVHRTLASLLPTVPAGTRIGLRRPNLDDVFMALTTRTKEGVSV